MLIPPDATVQSLARNSPFLLLAILTSSALMDPPLRHQLDQEFRRILSAKVVIDGQKSLDFLQGLLVYLAWLVESHVVSGRLFIIILLGIHFTLGPRITKFLCI